MAPRLHFRAVGSCPVLPTMAVFHQCPASALHVNWDLVSKQDPRRINSACFREGAEVRAQGWKWYIWICRSLCSASNTSLRLTPFLKLPPTHPSLVITGSAPGHISACLYACYLPFLLLLVSSASRIQAPQQRDLGSIRFFGGSRIAAGSQ